MSYCVNCGVEIDKSADICALCGCPVVNPMQPEKPEETVAAPFSKKIVIPKSVQKRYVSVIISIIIAIPNIICLITNAFLYQQGMWSLYIAISSALAWFLFVLPFILRKRNAYIILLLDTVCVSAYLYGIWQLVRDVSEGWYLEFALPLIIILSFFIAVVIKWTRKHSDGMEIAISVLLCTAAYSLAVDFFIHMYFLDVAGVSGSLIIVASCAVLIILLISAMKNQRFGDWLTRKFFV